MVKRKVTPKKGSTAGFAARTAPPVNDTTTESSEPTEDEVKSELSSNIQLESPRTPPKQVATARKSTAPLPKKSKHKATHNVKILTEIKRLQTSTQLLIPRAPFLRLVIRINKKFNFINELNYFSNFKLRFV